MSQVCWTEMIDGARVVGSVQCALMEVDENALPGQETRDSKKSRLQRGKALPGDSAVTMKGTGSAAQKGEDGSPLAKGRHGGKRSKVSSGYRCHDGKQMAL